MRSRKRFLACWMIIPGVLLLMVGKPSWQGVALAQATEPVKVQALGWIPSLRIIPYLNLSPERGWDLGNTALSEPKTRHFWDSQAGYSLLGRWLHQTFSPPAADFPLTATGTSHLGWRLIYNLNQESMAWPAFGISAQASSPATRDALPDRQWDAALNFSATKSLGEDSFLHRIKLTASWMHNFHMQENEDDAYYAFVFGYECQLGSSAELALNLVHEEQTLKDTSSNFIESGFRYHVTHNTLFWVGTGAGIGPDAPVFRSLFGFRTKF